MTLMDTDFEGGWRIKMAYNNVRDSVLGIATGYGLDDRGVGVRIPVG
jgi:hypothetical protein